MKPLQKLLSLVGLQKKSESGAWADIGTSTGGSVPKLTSPYTQSSWVFAAVNIIAREISGTAIAHDLGGKEYLSPVLDAFWRHPAKEMAYSDLITATVGLLSLEGSCYWVLDDTWLFAARPGAPRSPIQVVRPSSVAAIKAAGEIVGYTVTDSEGRRAALLPEQVISIKNWHPASLSAGVAPVEPAGQAIQADYLAGKFYLNVMANGVDQGFLMICKSGIPSEEQRKLLIASLRQRAALSSQQKPAITFVDADVEIHEPSIKAPDAAFSANRLANRHEIFIAFGIPASMADVAASYSIGSASDRYRLIEGTCKPIGEKIAEAMSRVSSRFENLSDLETRPDWDSHPVMVSVRREAVQSAQALWSLGMPMRDINNFLGLGMRPYHGWERGYLPFSVAPADAPLPEDDPANAEPPAAPAAPAEGKEKSKLKALADHDTLLSLLRKGPPAPAIHAACSCGCDGPATPEGEAFQKARPASQLAQWRDQVAKQRIHRLSLENALRRDLMAARAETLKRLEAQKGITALAAITKVGAAADLLFDLDGFEAQFTATTRAHAKRTLFAAAKDFAKEMAHDDPWQMPAPEVTEFLRNRENKLSGVPHEIHEKLKANLQAGMDKGETMAQLAGRVRSTFNDIAESHARTIAQTETCAAYNGGRMEAMSHTGVEYKQWLSSGNANVRPDHQAANGQIVTIDAPFLVGGELLQHPGDSSGSPGQVINCHCCFIAVDAPETPTQPPA